jgi:ATP adenylyltransferase/5',5'''-P-1,P-4-tetraphosphate phosphorylase II
MESSDGQKDIDISSMDFVEKKEKLCELMEAYVEDPQRQPELLYFVKMLQEDRQFKDKDLFQNVFKELNQYLSDLSRRDIKQRILMIRSYFDE